MVYSLFSLLLLFEFLLFPEVGTVLPARDPIADEAPFLCIFGFGHFHILGGISIILYTGNSLRQGIDFFLILLGARGLFVLKDQKTILVGLHKEVDALEDEARNIGAPLILILLFHYLVEFVKNSE